MASADNGQFWQLISAVSANWEQPNPWFVTSIAVVVVALINLTLTLLAYGRMTRYVLSALLCVSAAAAYFMDKYGMMLDPGMIQNIVETDRAESMELISAGLLGNVAVFGILPAIVIWRLLPSRQSVSGIFIEKAAVLGLSLLVVGVTVGSFFKDYASLARNNREIRFLLTPMNYLNSAYSVVSDQAAIPAVTVRIGEDARKGARWAGVKRGKVTVLVVGETARAANFSLGSYTRNTNPRLAKDSIIYFSNVSACGTSTRASLPCMFSDLTRADYSKDAARNREGMLDVLNYAGIRTLWLDNNSGCKGVCVNTPTWASSAADTSDWCVDDKCFDMVLLDELKKSIDEIQEDTVIVLHPKGSHGPSYYRRYPEEFRVFQPECLSDDLSDCTREEIVNSYDNTIFYTDFFLSQLIELLDGYSGSLDTAMLYVSDHGESLGEFGLYLHGAPYFIAPDTQTHVPMVLWMSSGYQQDFQINRTCLENRSAEHLSHDHLFHSMLGIMNIDTTVYNSELDLFSGCASPSTLARDDLTVGPES